MHTFSDTVAFFPYKTVSVCVDLVKHTTEKRLATVFLGRFLVSVSSSALNKSGSWTKYDLDVFCQLDLWSFSFRRQGQPCKEIKYFPPYKRLASTMIPPCRAGLCKKLDSKLNSFFLASRLCRDRIARARDPICVFLALYG